MFLEEHCAKGKVVASQVIESTRWFFWDAAFATV